jgi:hypothetical protein
MRKNQRWKTRGSTSDRMMVLIYLITFVYKLFGNRIYALKGVFEVMEYRYWLKTTFSIQRILPNRKKTLHFLIAEFDSNPLRKRIMEFGVAFGETTNFFIDNLQCEFEYHGFDSFEGLPKNWRGMPKGAIDACGVTPDIRKSGIFFYPGLIESTLTDSLLDDIFAQSCTQTLIFFDFDLYRPTLFALQRIQPFLKAEDIIYFDQAFDCNERLVIENYVTDVLNVKPLQASIFGLAFKVIERKVHV